MSDKFFDKDNNFIIWKDKGDLTEASKYVGDNKGSIGISESLATKIAKGKVDIDRTYGWKSEPFIVNWGKCGGTEDVIVTYNEGDPLWIPQEFLLEGHSTLWSRFTEPSTYPEVGFCTWFGYQDYGSRTERNPNPPAYWYNVYRLPQELGEWLYENAETAATPYLYGNNSGWCALYKGIAVYWDSIDTTIHYSGVWPEISEFGIGIRKKSDLLCKRADSSGNGTELDGSNDFSCCYNYAEYKKLDDNGYYMVVECSNGNAFTTMLGYSSPNSTDHLWLRHWKGMSQKPTADTSTHGAKYTCPKALCGRYGIIEKALTVNWGKCGGSSDVIITYNEGDPLWVPKAYLSCALDSSNILNANKVLLAGQVGFVGVGKYSSTASSGTGIWRLPDEIGKWLYDNAEDNLGTHDDYSSSSTTGNDQTRNYKGIALYSDNMSAWTDDYGGSKEWGVGIRKKEDILCLGWTTGGEKSYTTWYNYSSGDYISDKLDDNSYYLVFQANNEGNPAFCQALLSLTTVTDDTGSDHLFLRHYNTMTSAPSATNKGEKYTCPSEACSDMTTYTEKKDSLTVNWGKCGGSSDVIVTYNRDEGVWIPNAFLAQGTNGTSTSPKADQLYLSDGVTKDTSIGYKTYFTCNDYGDVTERQAFQSTYRLYIAVYKLPQELGRYLYETAESNLIRRAGVSSPIVDYSVSSDSSSSSMDRNYKGIAIYPDTVSNWEKSGGWGVGIRMKKDIPYVGMDDNGEPTTNHDIDNEGDDYSAIFNLSQWKALEDDAYYLVAQERGDLRDSTTFLTGQLSLFDIDDTGTDHIYFRHYNTMTAPPSATNKGEKYTLADFDKQLSFLIPNEDQVVIDWGGGIKTYYKYGEPMYVPRAFLMEAFDGVDSSNKVIHKPNNIGNHVGYQCWKSDIVVYRLPDEIGEYLYNSAESWAVGEDLVYNCTGSELTHIAMGTGKLYKGIAIYPDTFSNSDSSYAFGIGIRKKSDLAVEGLDNSGTTFSNSSFAEPLLDDNAYYLVAQSNNADGTSTYRHLYGQLASCFPKDEPIWFRHWKGVTAKPNGTTVMGKKMLYHPEYYAKPLGGKIFYIDSEDNGATYTFFDENKNEITGWSTKADLANAKYYMVDGTPSKDKFYVYYPTKYDLLPWEFFTISTGATGTAVGTGKINTATVMARTDIPSSIWSKLSEIRASSGIDDLFVPSKDEIDKFREADLEAWTRPSGGSTLWSSSEYTALHAWRSSGNYWDYSNKGGYVSVFFARAF